MVKLILFPSFFHLPLQSLYDITSGSHRFLNNIEEFSEVHCMDIRNGQIAALDVTGKVNNQKKKRKKLANIISSISVIYFLAGSIHKHRG